MPDLVYLLVDGKKIDRFLSYEIAADLYEAADAFTLEMARPEFRIRPGMACELYVNDTLELTGIIDKCEPSYDKSANTRKLVVAGRDTMGWLVDAHCEEFFTMQKTTFVSLAQRLLKNAPDEFFSLKTIDYSEAKLGRLKARGASVQLFDTSSSLSQIQVGMNIFEILSEYAKSRGLLFYALPNGDFVIGKPKEKGVPLFSLVNRKDGRGNNIQSGNLTNDISKRYSKITVIGQKQGINFDSSGEAVSLTPAQITVEATVTDSAFPFYKPYVYKDEYGGDSPKLQGRMLLEKMKHDGYKLSYTVQGHSQNNKNWTFNELAHVQDEDDDFAIDAVLLITGRTFFKSKDKGTGTKLRIGYPGLVA